MITTPTAPGEVAATSMLAFEVDQGWYRMPITGVEEILDGAMPHISVPRLPPQIAGLMKLQTCHELVPLVDVRRTLRLDRGDERVVDPRHEALTERIVVFRTGNFQAAIRCDRVSPTLAGVEGSSTTSWGAPSGPLPVLNLRRLLRAARMDPDADKRSAPKMPAPHTVLTTKLGGLHLALDANHIGTIAGVGEEAAESETMPRLDLATWFKIGALPDNPADRKLLRIASGHQQALIKLGSTVHVRPVDTFHPLPAVLGAVAAKAGVTGVAVDRAGNELVVADVSRLLAMARPPTGDKVASEVRGRPAGRST